MTLWQKSIGLTVTGIGLFFVAIASSICPPALHAPIVIASASLLILSLGLVSNLRASSGGSHIAQLKMALLGVVQITAFCFEVWALLLTKNP
jgi:hypothetical protein